MSVATRDSFTFAGQDMAELGVYVLRSSPSDVAGAPEVYEAQIPGSGTMLHKRQIGAVGTPYGARTIKLDCLIEFITDSEDRDFKIPGGASPESGELEESGADKQVNWLWQLDAIADALNHMTGHILTVGCYPGLSWRAVVSGPVIIEVGAPQTAMMSIEFIEVKNAVAGSGSGSGS